MHAYHPNSFLLSWLGQREVKLSDNKFLRISLFEQWEGAEKPN